MSVRLCKARGVREGEASEPRGNVTLLPPPLLLSGRTGQRCKMANESKDMKRTRDDALRDMINTILERLIDIDVNELSFEEQGDFLAWLEKIWVKLKSVHA